MRLSEFAAKEKWAFAHSFLRAPAYSRNMRGQTRLQFKNTPPGPRFQTTLSQPAVANAAKSIYDFFSMARTIKVVVALLCLTCVLALCIAPWVDPPETTLKSLQLIFFLILTFAACAFWLAGLLPLTSQSLAEPVPDICRLIPNLLSRETSCVQRC
jgi:hypothetical protein